MSIYYRYLYLVLSFGSELTTLYIGSMSVLERCYSNSKNNILSQAITWLSWQLAKFYMGNKTIYVKTLN